MDLQGVVALKVVQSGRSEQSVQEDRFIIVGVGASTNPGGEVGLGSDYAVLTRFAPPSDAIRYHPAQAQNANQLESVTDTLRIMSFTDWLLTTLGVAAMGYVLRLRGADQTAYFS